MDPSILVDQAFKWQLDCGWEDEGCVYVADAGGMGQGVMHLFYEAGKRIFEFHNGSVAIDYQRYANKVTEAWFGLARKARKGLCSLPADNILLQQLCSRQYYMNKKGKIILETKDEFKKRGNDSPDRADGCVMAFYDEIEAEEGSVITGYGSRTVGLKTRT